LTYTRFSNNFFSKFLNLQKYVFQLNQCREVFHGLLWKMVRTIGARTIYGGPAIGIEVYNLEDLTRLQFADIFT